MHHSPRMAQQRYQLVRAELLAQRGALWFGGPYILERFRGTPTLYPARLRLSTTKNRHHVPGANRMGNIMKMLDPWLRQRIRESREPKPPCRFRSADSVHFRALYPRLPLTWGVHQI